MACEIFGYCLIINVHTTTVCSFLAILFGIAIEFWDSDFIFTLDMYSFSDSSIYDHRRHDKYIRYIYIYIYGIYHCQTIPGQYNQMLSFMRVI